MKGWIEGVGGIKIPFREIEQSISYFRPETITEGHQRLSQHPETALLPLGIFPMPHGLSRSFTEDMER